MLHSIYLQELEPLVKTITAKTSSSSKVFEYHSDQLQWPSSSRWWWIALCMYIVNSSVVILTTHMYDSDHQHHHHSRITFCYRMEKNPGHGIHRSNGALLSKISGKLQPSPPFSFWLFFGQLPQAAASLFMHPLEFSSLIYYMHCSAFEKLGNKKPPCFPPPLLWISLYGKCANGFFLYVGGTLGGVALVLQDICSILVIHEMLLLVLNKVLLTQRFR